jgi:DNA-binding NtrC family response regulator
LLEAELFGALRGAYTGCERDRPGLLRQAADGTLFLDEVGEMSPGLQGKLLRFLDDGRVRPVGGTRDASCDVRIVSATHRDLRRSTETGRFRNDLWWRLAVIRIEVPALRQRLSDLPLIVARLAPCLETECGRGPLQLTEAAWARLSEHCWPGNIRELRGVLARALLDAADLPLDADSIQLDPAPGGEPIEAKSLEERMIREALDSSAGHIGRAAARIGWSRQKLYRRMSALGLRTAQSTRRVFEPTTSSANSTFQ